jgi:hypothetical protein
MNGETFNDAVCFNVQRANVSTCNSLKPRQWVSTFFLFEVLSLKFEVSIGGIWDAD